MNQKMRPQMTVYIDEGTKRWLQAYAHRCGQPESQVVKSLLARERRIRWLEWSLEVRDPDQDSIPKALQPPRKKGRSKPNR